ncbi:energy-coupled thiamine transporter ThiT [Evansella tamaricis]|uniref:Energy-coupled thiamine transporter ThiT n=1 Tax=Evansella tamaricis TaxID=2069301 RepID=A0ABS6JGE7_9BACI|nr:energy-coupled thiamine transporter ThiT [Evansella tamaricis]MBU9712470.1 energy-coupled thiamine transporter ThiT [Evansella tamaricis]
MRNSRPLVIMAEVAIMSALAIVLDFFSFKVWAQGGSVSLIMLPIFVVAFRRGLKYGLLTGLIVGLLNMLIQPSIYHPVQAIVDYPIAFLGVGLAGIFYFNSERVKNNPIPYLIIGVLIGSLWRFLAHFYAGIVWFGVYAPEGTPVPWYSFTYNMTYMGPAFLLCLVVLLLLYKANRRILNPNA